VNLIWALRRPPVDRMADVAIVLDVPPSLAENITLAAHEPAPRPSRWRDQEQLPEVARGNAGPHVLGPDLGSGWERQLRCIGCSSA
jgi:hypothetical protein